MMSVSDGCHRTFMHARRWIMFGMLLLSGCSGYTGPRGLASDDASQLVPAIKQAAERNDTNSIPILIQKLNHEDPAVRFYAIEALKRLTGQTLGYRYFDDDDDRKAAIARWEQWLDEKSTPRPTEDAGPTTRPDLDNSWDV